MMHETKSTRIVAVEPCAGHSLRVAWASGVTWKVDLRKLVFGLRGLRPLRDPGAFSRAKVGEGGHSVAWPGELDVGADRLWELSLAQNGHDDAAEFLRWRWRHGLSLSASAEALGLSRRIVAYYSGGDRPVPRTVLLACKGWEAEQRQAA